MTVFVAGTRDDASVLYCYHQYLEHGDMPLPTYDDVVAMVSERSPEARNVHVYRDDVVADGAGENRPAGRRLALVQKLVLDEAGRLGVPFEIHVLDYRPIQDRSGGAPNLPASKLG